MWIDPFWAGLALGIVLGIALVVTIAYLAGSAGRKKRAPRS